MTRRYRHALVIGKFYPPHRGHHALIRRAVEEAVKVTAVVMASGAESVALRDRTAWLRSEHGSEPVTVAGVRCEAPLDLYDEQVWAAQVAAIRSAVRTSTLGVEVPVDVVVTGEGYGSELARRLGADHVHVDRTTDTISGTAVRSDLAGHWADLAAATRAGLACRVVFLGAESTGTSTIAAAVAGHYRARGGVWARTGLVGEYGRDYTSELWEAQRALARESGTAEPSLLDLVWGPADFDAVARQQTALEEAAARDGSPLLVCDTDAFATAVWERRYLGSAARPDPDWARPPGLPRHDLYLLTGHDGVPWVDDGIREGDLAVRAAMTEWFADALTRAGHPRGHARGLPRGTGRPGPPLDRARAAPPARPGRSPVRARLRTHRCGHCWHCDCYRGRRGVPMNLTPAQMDRAAGVMVAMAAGDALGAGYEFRTPPAGEPAMIGGGLGDWDPGEWTDDTQMAICIAAEAATGRLAPEPMAGRFLDWYRSGPADVGIQTRHVLSRAAGASDVASRARAWFESNPGGAAGNGSLMRTAPVALAHLGDDRAIAQTAGEISALTHADPLAGEACILWCIAIDRAVREARLDGVHDGVALLPPDRRPFWAERLAEAESRPPATFAPNGFVVTALQAAHASIVQTPVPSDVPCRHLQLSLGTAVRIGHDTDTVAAIAGALLGARWGASAVPLGWKALLHGWPGLQVRDLVRMAVLAGRRGADDSTGWPSTPSMQPYYRSTFHPSGHSVALPDDPGLRIGDVARLANLGDDSDVVVSLCRIGRTDAGDREVHEVWLMDSADPEENPNLDFLLSDIAAQVARWRDQGRTVFIHCVRAESRTPTVAAACLAERLGISGAEALQRVRTALPGCRPNAGFVAALDRVWPGAGGQESSRQART